MSPEQSRAARGWLGWSQTELAKRARVSLSTVRDFETGARMPIPNNVAAMQRAIEEAGIALIEQNGKAVGVRLSEGARGDPVRQATAANDRRRTPTTRKRAGSTDGPKRA